MGNHAVIRKDRLYGTDVAPNLVSLKYFVSTTPTAIDNGNVVKKGSGKMVLGNCQKS